MSEPNSFKHTHLWVLSPQDGRLHCVICQTATDVPHEEARKIREFELLLKQGKRTGLTVTGTAEKKMVIAKKTTVIRPEGTLTVEEAAKELGLEPRVLRRKLRATGHKKGGTRWFLSRELMDHMKQK